jgi:hypothetical protein
MALVGRRPGGARPEVLAGGLDGLGGGLDELGHVVGMGDHRQVAGWDFRGGGTHPRAELPFGVGRDDLVVLAAQVTVNKYATGLGLNYQGEYLAALATSGVTVSSPTQAHGVLSFNESQVAQTIETLARAGVKASASLFDASLIS